MIEPNARYYFSVLNNKAKAGQGRAGTDEGKAKLRAGEQSNGPRREEHEQSR